MRNSVFAIVLLVLVVGCGAAWAADPAATTTYNWTGFYAGLNTGLAKNDSWYTLSQTGEFFMSPPAAVRELTSSGNLNNPAFTAGGQLGYNYQVGNFVYGLETDFNYNSTDNSSTSTFGVFTTAGPVGVPSGGLAYTVNQQIDYFGTLRARFGFTPADRLLIYVTGGLAYGDVSSSTNIPTYGPGYFYGSSSGMEVGWTAGAGSEYALTNNWSVKLEYLFIDLGSMSYPVVSGVTGTGFTALTANIDTAQHVLRVGLNYKF